jgi:hypothetical protein
LKLVFLGLVSIERERERKETYFIQILFLFFDGAKRKNELLETERRRG